MADPRRRKTRKLLREQLEERFTAPDDFEGNLRLVIAGGPDPEPHGSADERKADDDG